LKSQSIPSPTVFQPDSDMESDAERTERVIARELVDADRLLHVLAAKRPQVARTVVLGMQRLLEQLLAAR
jgi:hypothetical protein